MSIVRRTFVPALVGAGLLSISCGGGGGGGGGPTGTGGNGLPQGDVTLTASSFQPRDLSIRVGETVTWVNSTTLLHTITPDGHAEWTRREVSRRGDTFRATFDREGVYWYYCEIHGAPGAGMYGRIIVGDVEAPPYDNP